MKNWIISFFLISGITISNAQLKITTFEQILQAKKTEKRKVIVFIYTDWCKYCHVMKETTLKEDYVMETVNEKFYFVDFNAESQESISFNNTIYHYKPSGKNSGIHDLAVLLGTKNGQIQFPVVCILNENNEIMYQRTGYLSAKAFIRLLRTL